MGLRQDGSNLDKLCGHRNCRELTRHTYVAPTEHPDVTPTEHPDVTPSAITNILPARTMCGGVPAMWRSRLDWQHQLLQWNALHAVKPVVVGVLSVELSRSTASSILNSSIL